MGWSYFGYMPETDLVESSEPQSGNDIILSFSKCFASPWGDLALKHLRAITVERTIDPSAPESLLRHVEGQRHLVKHIESLIRRGTKCGNSPIVGNPTPIESMREYVDE